MDIFRFVVTLALFSVAARGSDLDLGLKLLCNYQPVKLTTISQFKSITKNLKDDSSSSSVGLCSEPIREAILNLLTVIDELKEDVCTLENVDKIRAYHSKYIMTNDGSVKLPKSLRKFFLGFGFKVSSICKKDMITFLLYDTREQLKPEDFSTMELWTRAESPMFAAITGNPSDFDDILLASDLALSTSGADSSGGESSAMEEKIFIQIATGDQMKRAQTTCRNRFKPFYDRLILPVVALSNLGYNYKGEDLERELAELKDNKEVHDWYKIVYICESLKDIELIEDPEDKLKTDGIDRKLVRILNSEEAAALKAKSGQANKSIENDPDKIFYKPEGTYPMDNMIIDESNRDLLRLINNFDASKTEADRVRKRMLLKVGDFLKKALLRGDFHIVTSLFSESSPKREIVKALDDYVHGVAESSSPEGPVAGNILSYGKRVYHNANYLGQKGMINKITQKAVDKNYGKWFYRGLTVLLFIAALSVLSMTLG